MPKQKSETHPLVETIFPVDNEFHYITLSKAKKLIKSLGDPDKGLLLGSMLATMQSIATDMSYSVENKVAAIAHLASDLHIAISESDKEIILPVLTENDEWENLTYTIGRISVSPKFLPQQDQADAITMTPVSPDQGPLIIFSPTVPPGIKGSWLTRFADFFPFASIGWPLTRTNKELNEWINKQQSGVHVIGASLGGALALAHCARVKSDIIKTIKIFNPALPWFAPRINCKNIEVWYDANDPVKMVGGQVPKQATVRIVEAKAQKGGWYFFRKLQAHLRIFVVAQKASKEMTGAEYNKSNRTLTSFILYWILRPILFIPHLVAFIISCAVHYYKESGSVMPSLDDRMESSLMQEEIESKQVTTLQMQPNQELRTCKSCKYLMREQSADFFEHSLV